VTVARGGGTDGTGDRPGLVRRAGTALRTLLDRLALGVLTGGGTALVLAWAGTSWRTALLVGGGGVLAVALAAWVASTVPPVPGTQAPTPPGATPGDAGGPGSTRGAP
jgi:hypothetical protein